MFDLIKQYTFHFVLGLFFIKYLIQFYLMFSNRKQRIVSQKKPYVSSKIIWLIALIIFSIFIFNKNNITNQIIGLVTLFGGIVIGLLGLIYLNKNFHNNLVVYENSSFVKLGIYSIIRHPIRLGICMETLSLVIFINSTYLVPMLLFYLYLNYKRTLDEEQFLIESFKSEAILYFEKVPQFNIFKGLYLKFNHIDLHHCLLYHNLINKSEKKNRD